ncbi:hypothetical protein FMEAI12_3640157 [Parafrankia sp. Ea1.12]|nr:hypothetical protein FMEAI12_3640157 [Parafrankia sp. Ea1.12]
MGTGAPRDSVDRGLSPEVGCHRKVEAFRPDGVPRIVPPDVFRRVSHHAAALCIRSPRVPSWLR